MSPIESPPNSRAIAAWPNVLAGLYVLALFVSLRLLDDTSRVVGLVIAWLAFAGMIAGRIRGRLAADADGKRLLLLVGTPADVLLLVGGALCEWAVFADKPPEPAMPAGVLALLAGGAITLALELALAPMRATGFVDNRRVQAAARTAATLVCAVAGLSGLCYGVEKLDIRRDFSFAAPTSPSKATLSLLDAAACPSEATGGSVSGGGPAAGSAGAGEGLATAPQQDGKTTGKPEVYLFFERGSTGLGEIRDYFDALQKAGAKVTTEDSALDPALAKEMHVSRNGMVGFRCGKRTDSYSVGEDREEAQRKVAHLDEEVRTKLAKLSKEPATVYMTVGHGERSADAFSKPGDRPSAKNLKKLVEALNGRMKRLGVADGLTKEVPKEASLVIVAGPTTPFLPDEANALARYVKDGGSLLLMLDPKVGDQPDVVGSLQPLLDAMNVTVSDHEMLNDKAYVQNTHTDADHAFLYSTSFGSHKSVRTLSMARGKAALLFMSAGAVEKKDSKMDEKTGPRVSIIARTPPGTFIDKNDDRKWTEKDEVRSVLDFAAAVEMPKNGDKEGRAIVVGDSDVLADMLIAQDANQVFGYETILWLLRDDDKLSAEGIQADADVPIRHTRDEDTVWFYATVFAGPVLCIGGGLTFVRLKRRRKKTTTGGKA